MAYLNRPAFQPILSVAAASIGATYTSLGTLSNDAVLVVAKNRTDGDVFISFNGVDDNLLLIPNEVTSYNITTNSPYLTSLLLPKGATISVKDGPTAPTTGSLYFEILTAIFS